jgi:hypothetical protein
MMIQTPYRARTTALRGVALLALIAAAGTAGTALSDESSTPSHVNRAAILASADATAAQVSEATAQARRDGAQTVVVRHVGGPWEAQAQAAALGSAHLDRVVGVGADARTAVGQAAASELSGETRWTTSG